VKLIPNEFVNQMPERVLPTYESCQSAADATLTALFMMGAQLDEESQPEDAWPLILSGDPLVEVYPLPAPYEDNASALQVHLDNLNGDVTKTGLLPHAHTNALAYNSAILENKPDVAKAIAALGPADAAAIWNNLNGVCMALAPAGGVYSPIVLENLTKISYQRATGEEVAVKAEPEEEELEPLEPLPTSHMEPEKERVDI
jgi:hypothetical protein